MNTKINSLGPYLFFEGRCDEAIKFYTEVLGAKVLFLMRFKESPEPCDPASAEKVMHATLTIGDIPVMVSDGRCGGHAHFAGFSLSLTVPDEAAARELFGKLSEGGQVRMPLDKTFFSPAFGMVADRFGVPWMVHVASEPPKA